MVPLILLALIPAAEPSPTQIIESVYNKHTVYSYTQAKELANKYPQVFVYSKAPAKWEGPVIVLKPNEFAKFDLKPGDNYLIISGMVKGIYAEISRIDLDQKPLKNFDQPKFAETPKPPPFVPVQNPSMPKGVTNDAGRIYCEDNV